MFLIADLPVLPEANAVFDAHLAGVEGYTCTIEMELPLTSQMLEQCVYSQVLKIQGDAVIWTGTVKSVTNSMAYSKIELINATASVGVV